MRGNSENKITFPLHQPAGLLANVLGLYRVSVEGLEAFRARKAFGLKCFRNPKNTTNESGKATVDVKCSRLLGKLARDEHLLLTHSFLLKIV